MPCCDDKQHGIFLLIKIAISLRVYKNVIANLNKIKYLQEISKKCTRFYLIH